MVSFTTVVVAAFAGLAAATCGDNCVRNVGATRFGNEVFSKRLSDCAAYMATTVTAPATTVTSTITTATVTLDRVQTVPEYATKCTNDPFLYRSACNCNSVGVSTVTVVPTVVEVVQVAATTQVPQIVYQGV